MSMMNIINIGEEFNIYRADTVKTFTALPTQIYTVKFHKMRGFYLESYKGLEIKEKVYGVHDSKVEKVIKSFNAFERSLGIILSGDKGIGKSLFAKMLANKCVANNIPVIVVQKYIPGIADFIESIQQEVMILFDEFDKTFGEVEASEGQSSPQTELLGLFDGISTASKRLYVITCNELRKLNDYLVNRPGRFHYHLRFEYPSAEEVTIYLKDKLKPEYYSQIQDVISFCKRTDINYDCLRAIAFEINLGIPFKEAIKDLNILNMNSDNFYTIKVLFEDGTIITKKKYRMNLDADWSYDLWLSPPKSDKEFICISWIPENIEWNDKLLTHVISGDNIEYSCDKDYCKDDVELFTTYNKKKISYVSFERDYKNDKLHYTL